MQVEEFIALYEQDGWVATLAEKLRANSSKYFQIKGLTGSIGAVLGTAIYKRTATTQLFILHDNEEAAYFYSDLQSLLGQETVHLFPASPEPYATEATDSPAQLMRAEALSYICNPGSQHALIVTYPAALTKKVISKGALAKSRQVIQVGQELVLSYLTTQLVEQGFEKTDFVYEVGQFAIRGGIIDIFSYAYQLPFRMELWGNTIESIRTFDPSSQRSLEPVHQAIILPDCEGQTKEPAYQSLLEVLPSATTVWIKDYEMILGAIEKNYAHATEIFQKKVVGHQLGEPLQAPETLWETPESWSQALQKLKVIEFGTRFYGKPDEVLTYEASPQPSFNQNFALLASDLHQNQTKGLENILVAESEEQFERLRTIFAELDEEVKFSTLQLGLHQGYLDYQIGVACYTDHQLFNRYYRYKTPKRYSKAKAVTLRELQALQPGDYVVHLDYGIGRFAGLSKVEVNGKEQEALRLIYKDNDVLYTSLQSLHKVSKYTSKEGEVPSIAKLGSSAWDQKKKRVKSRVKNIAKELIELYSKRKQVSGFAFSQDSFLQAELESSFIYEDTPDQAAATAAVKKDMEMPHPMDRLVCGDVGFGKTEVAIRAAFKAVNDDKQVAVLVPTTILALQHYNSFCARLERFKVKVAYINRFKTDKEIKETLEATAAGKVDILIGTHRILSKSVQFHDLGLLIIDEEQRFGVKAKEQLKRFKLNVDVLTLTATPIPRTLHFSLMGARDLSIIATPPTNRQPVETLIHTFDQGVIKDAINYELQRGGQVFFVHNRIANIEEVAHMIYKIVPECRVGVAHGQMEGTQLEQRMLRFVQGEYDALVATSIIEAGLDIPNANTIIINDSHLFGLSDLHQLRGRVGRSNKKAFCYLLAPPSSVLTAEARRRLQALEEFSELGDGFKVAMRDLDIRGAGDLLGAEQSGFIAEVGFDIYCKILDEAVMELKEEEFKELFEEEIKEKAKEAVLECTLETDLEALIPDTYVSNVSERIHLYSKLDRLQDETELQAFQGELIDRFGPLPQPVQVLIELVQLRWVAQRLGLVKLRLKSGVMRCCFVATVHPQQTQILESVLDYVQQHSRVCQLKEVKGQLLLTIDPVAGIKQAQKILQDLQTTKAAKVALLY